MPLDHQFHCLVPPLDQAGEPICKYVILPPLEAVLVDKTLSALSQSEDPFSSTLIVASEVSEGVDSCTVKD